MIELAKVTPQINNRARLQPGVSGPTLGELCYIHSDQGLITKELQILRKVKTILKSMSHRLIVICDENKKRNVPPAYISCVCVHACVYIMDFLF